MNPRQSSAVSRARLSITPPAPFDFRHNARSHGWVELAPNAWDEERGALRRVERLSTGRVVRLDIAGRGTRQKPEIRIDVSWPGAAGDGGRHHEKLSAPERREISAAVGRMFRVEEDFSEFYARCRKRGKRWARLTTGLGRILRSPSVFEDFVKTISTTNIQWGGTRRMVEGLVKEFGEAYAEDPSLRAFPTPEAIASVSPGAFVERVRLGYRGPYVHLLAEQVAAGKLDLEALRDSEIPTAELKKRLLVIKGVGNYAAATLLMLLGRYDELAVDTAYRQFVRKKYFNGRRPSDEKARAVYASWGQWKSLAFWFDIWESFQGSDG